MAASIHGQWSSRWAFILAATGSAVGLGNIWRFPYMVGENGGGAFVLVYLVCVAVIGIPIMMAEVLLGRRGRMSPIQTMGALARIEGTSPSWSLIGWMGMLAGFLILSYYSVIAGWTVAYVFRSASGGLDLITKDGAGAMFGALVSDPEKLLAWHTIFMVMTVIVSARGVQHGLEKAVRFLMPALFILLLVLVGYAMNAGDFARGVEFMFHADFSKITAGAVLDAMGQAFFSLSLGMGAIMMYGSYLPQDSSISTTTATIALADTAVAVLAGLAIFPIVFAFGLEVNAGPSLIFQTLPIAFGQMPGGAFFGTLFFVLLVFAAWTSAISLLEPAVAWLVEKRGWTRIMAAAWAGIVAWALGIVTLLSFSSWDFSFHFFGSQKSNGLFTIFEILTNNIMLPLGGILIAVFAGWKMASAHTREELAIGNDFGYALWVTLTRFVAPALVFLIFLNLFGVLDWLLG
ncbi:MAG: sodium-dependent transporter [Gammaproteobacteria bacterium]|jgi:NSS family neurotransmitter:Na+ symporter|nr:sodium-dependent transporter [Gammaproteobacteria bacterium]